MMATIALCRASLRRHAVPTTLALSSGLYLANRRQPTRLDAFSSSTAPPVAPRSLADERSGKEWLSPEVIRQLSGGSLAGK